MVGGSMRALLIGLLLVVAPLPAPAQVSDAERKQCTGEGAVIPAEARIANCTALIESGRVPPAELFHAVNSRGAAWYEKGDLERAIADFDRVIELKPDYADGFYNRAVAWSARGDVERAIADYSAAVRLAPDHARAYNNRGDLLDKQGDFDRAIADYSKAIRLKPDYVLAFYNRGNAWLHKRDLDRAVADYGSAIRLDPGFADAFVARGIAWSGKGDADRAIADFDKAIRLRPDRALAFTGRGNARRLKGDLARAIADYDAAIKLAPTDAKALSARADAQAERGMHREALADKLAAAGLVAKTAENAGYFSDVGDMQYALGAYAEAEPWFATAVELAPTSNWDRLYLFLARRWQGKDDGTALARHAATLDPNTKDAYAQVIRFAVDPAKRAGEVSRRVRDIMAAWGDDAAGTYARCGVGYALLEVQRATGYDDAALRELALAALNGSERCARYHNVARTAQLTPTQ
jgi:tetratricopeptide (TPR) repeat protein